MIIKGYFSLYTHTHPYAPIRTYTHTYAHIRTHTHLYAHIRTYTHLHALVLEGIKRQTFKWTKKSIYKGKPTC